MSESRVSVIVPSYRRPARLAECLDGIARSERQPEEVIVVLRAHDRESATVVSERYGYADVVYVDAPGVLAAMRAGVERATGDILVFLDDDAVPDPSWITRGLAHLNCRDVGGIGGRDIVTEPDDRPRVAGAGRLTTWGKMIGNHHLVTGPVRQVDVLKAANMAFRREALALPIQLLGDGAQVHFELATCLWARNHGWRLVLDPDAEVLHLPGERFDADARAKPSIWAAHRAACNFTWCVLSMRPRLIMRRLLYGILVGDKAVPGLGRAVLAIARREQIGWIWARLLPSITGQLRGAALVLAGRRVEMVQFNEVVASGAQR